MTRILLMLPITMHTDHIVQQRSHFLKTKLLIIRRALPRACQITSLAIWNMKQPSSKCQRCSAILFVSCNNFRQFRIQIMFFHNKFEQCFNSCSNNCFLFEKCAREGVCQGAPGHWNRVLFESVWATLFEAFF